VITLAVGLVVWRSWGAQSESLRRAILILPVFAGLYLVGGIPGEVRGFAELFPVLTLTLVQALPAAGSWAPWARMFSALGLRRTAGR